MAIRAAPDFNPCLHSNAFFVYGCGACMQAPVNPGQWLYCVSSSGNGSWHCALNNCPQPITDRWTWDKDAKVRAIGLVYPQEGEKAKLQLYAMGDSKQQTDNMLYTIRCMMVLNELDELSVQGLIRALDRL